MDARGPIHDPKATLRITRVIWGGLVMGVSTMGAVFAFLITNGDEMTETGGDSGMIFLIASSVLTLLVIPVGLFARGQVFKAGWVGDVVKPMHYQTGNIIAWACCEGAAMFGLITCFLTRSFWPYALPPAAAFVMLLLLWPNGRAMFPPHDPYETTRR